MGPDRRSRDRRSRREVLQRLTSEDEGGSRRGRERRGSGSRYRRGKVLAVVSDVAKELDREGLQGALDLGIRGDVHGVRGVVDGALHLHENIQAIASADFASTRDWSAMAGVKIRW